MTDAAALLTLYDSIKHRTSMTIEEFARAIVRFSLVTIVEDGKCIGVVMVDRNEVHIGLKARPRWSHRGDIRRILCPLLRKYGELRTGVMAENDVGLEFCRRLGFEEVKRDERGVYLVCKGGPLYGHG